MRAAHFKCGRDDGVSLNNLAYDRVRKLFRSGRWDISAQEAQDLVGGWVYLHPRKTAASEFGGVVVGFEPVEVAEAGHPHRIVLHVEKRSEGTGQRWRGQSHALAHKSGLVEAGLPHEV